MKRQAAIFIWLFAIPLFGLAVGAFAGDRFSCDMAAALFSFPDLAGRPGFFERSGARAHVLHACRTVGGIHFLVAMSVGALTMTVALIVTTIWNARTAGRTPHHAAQIFRSSVVLALRLSAALVMLSGLIAACALYVLSAIVGAPLLAIMGATLLLGGVLGAAQTLGAIATMRAPVTLESRASLASPDAQPELWRFVREIAARLDVKPPENILLGLDPLFYATAAGIKLDGQDKALAGETLHLSLPLLHVLDKEEAAAIVGHELGHFKGEDAAFTLQFAPAYLAIAHVIESPRQLRLWTISLLPAYAVLGFCLDRFAAADGAIRRRRELAADRAGAEASTPCAMARVLFKLAAFGQVWNALEEQVKIGMKEGLAHDNLCSVFEEGIEDVLKQDESALLKLATDSQPLHPFDPHPPLAERTTALGIDLSESTDWLRRQGIAALTLVADADGLGLALTEQWNRSLWHQLGPGANDSPAPVVVDKKV
jgi:Zn-dependent protease with chaperone function